MAESHLQAHLLVQASILGMLAPYGLDGCNDADQQSGRGKIVVHKLIALCLAMQALLIACMPHWSPTLDTTTTCCLTHLHGL